MTNWWTDCDKDSLPRQELGSWKPIHSNSVVFFNFFFLSFVHTFVKSSSVFISTSVFCVSQNLLSSRSSMVHRIEIFRQRAWFCEVFWASSNFVSTLPWNLKTVLFFFLKTLERVKFIRRAHKYCSPKRKKQKTGFSCRRKGRTFFFCDVTQKRAAPFWCFVVGKQDENLSECTQLTRGNCQSLLHKWGKLC